MESLKGLPQVKQEQMEGDKTAVVRLRVPVFDYWKREVDAQYSLAQSAAAADGSYIAALNFKDSPIHTLHERFVETATQIGDKRTIQLSRKDVNILIDNTKIPFNAGDAAILKEMRRELQDSLPARNPMNILRGMFKRK